MGIFPGFKIRPDFPLMQTTIPHKTPGDKSRCWHQPCLGSSMNSITLVKAESPEDQRSPKGIFSGLVQKMRNLLRDQIPIGYEDENGFHTGVPPMKNNH